MKKQSRNLAYIHFAVLLFGVAGLFGKLIELPAIIITLGRVFFASLGIGAVLFFRKLQFKLNSKSEYIFLTIAGLILAFHWWSFFYSIQLSTVAIGLLTFSSFPIFTLFLEPLFYKEKFRYLNLFVTTLTVLGIYLIIPEFDIKNNYFVGAIWGIVSGFTFSFFQLMNRKLVKTISGLKISFYEVTIATIVLIPFVLNLNVNITFHYILLLALLGLIFTAIAHTLFIMGLEKISVFKSSIITSLEPVYGIVIAIFLLSEIPDYKTILGGILIISSNLAIVFVNRNLSSS